MVISKHFLCNDLVKIIQLIANHKKVLGLGGPGIDKNACKFTLEVNFQPAGWEFSYRIHPHSSLHLFLKAIVCDGSNLNNQFFDLILLPNPMTDPWDCYFYLHLVDVLCMDYLPT